MCGVNTKVVELFSQCITLTFQNSHVTAEELGNTKKIKIFSKLENKLKLVQCRTQFTKSSKDAEARSSLQIKQRNPD